jgi:Concanavalin A-like lectin/glucanases superfamily
VTDTLERLAPLEVWTPQGEILVAAPDQRSISYPGNDAWLELEARVADPGADPAWAHVETVPDSGGIPNKVIGTTTNVPQISTTTSVFGGSSLLAGGSGYALSTPDHDDWTFGAGDFTVEGWFRWAVARKCMFAHLAVDNVEHGWEWTMDIMSSATPGFSFLASTAASPNLFDIQIDRAFTVTLNQWYHMAVVRLGTVIRQFVDGVQIGADYNIGTTAFRNAPPPLRILGDARGAGGGNDFNGYADELRISKGIARYTGSSFTVPTAPFVRDQYTVLLMHFDGPNGGTSFTDSSGVAGAPFDPGSDPAWMEVER